MKTLKTMKTRLFLIGCGAAMITMTSGCTKDNPLNPEGNCFDGKWAAQFSDELQAYSNAISDYNENPTQGNCDDYKNAAKGYLDALNEVYNCVPTASRAEIDQAINEAKADIDGEDCD
jgi:hypothetical protein